MSKSSAPAEPKVMPALPNAAIDFNALHEAEAKGATGDTLIAAAVAPFAATEAVEEAPAAPVVEPPPPSPPAPTRPDPHSPQ